MMTGLYNKGRPVPPRSVNHGHGPEQKRLDQNYSRCIDILVF